MTQPFKLFGRFKCAYLTSKLPARRDHQNQGLVGAPPPSRGAVGIHFLLLLLHGQDLLENGYQIGQGLSVPGLRGHQTGVAVQDLGDGLFLDACRGLETLGSQG